MKFDLLHIYMQVVKLCDLGSDDSVCSVGWAQSSAQLAVGTSNGKLQVWFEFLSSHVIAWKAYQFAFNRHPFFTLYNICFCVCWNLTYSDPQLLNLKVHS